MAEDFKQLPLEVAARPGRAQRTTVRALQVVPADWYGAETQVQRLIREERSLRSTERRFVADAAWSILRRYNAWHRLAREVSTEADPPPLLLYFLYLVVGRGLSPDIAAHHLHEAGIEADPGTWHECWKRLLARSTPPERLALEYGVPLWLIAHLERTWTAELPELLATLNERAPVDFRVNIARIGRKAVREQLARQGAHTIVTPYSPWGLRLEGHTNVRGLPAVRKGLVDLQDEGSQLIVRLAGVEAGQHVADVCAGGGGKSVALAPLVGKNGRLIGMDADRLRLRSARERMRKLGFHYDEEILLSTCAEKTADRLAPWQEMFDRVLVDAPCSGTGAWRRHPAARWHLKESFLAAVVETQAQLLEHAAGLVRVGGRLVYATCSVLAEENAAQIQAFLGRQPTFRVVPVADILSGTAGVLTDSSGRYLSLAPHRQGTDGFFGAVLERTA